MAQGKLTITVTLAWWLRPYLFGVALASTLMGIEPDWHKVTRVVDRALLYRFE